MMAGVPVVVAAAAVSAAGLVMVVATVASTVGDVRLLEFAK